MRQSNKTRFGRRGHTQRSKYENTFDRQLKRNIFYIPSPQVQSWVEQTRYATLNETNTTVSIVDVFNKNGNYGDRAYIYNFIVKIINHQLWQYPVAINNMMNSINNMIHSDTQYSEKDIYKVIRDYYINITNNRHIPNKLIEVEGAQRGINRMKSIEKNVLRYSPIKPTCYLDIGCFDGNITNAIGNYFRLSPLQVYGVDIVDFPNMNSNITFNQYDGITLPFSNDSFDLVTCLMTLHHIPEENLCKLLTEIHRVMRPGGIIIIREHDCNNKIENIGLDIMHNFYDHVWNNDDEKWRSEKSGFEKANYKSNITWTKLFVDNGFIVNTKPSIFINENLNPFMSYFVSYKKINTSDIVGETQDLKPLYRILPADMFRETYRRKTSEIKKSIHWGQRKLLLTEIEFLTIFLNNVESDKDIYVIYAGAAPGTHILYLSELFPTIHFELYDPRDFSPKLNKSEMINTHVQYFTDDTAREWIADEHKDKIILLVSDIRTGDTETMDSKEVEERVKIDHEWQKNWYDIMKPEMAMFKFRLPWDYDNLEYLDGDIYIQPYPPSTSTETRLIIKANAGMKTYDNRKYEEQMFYFNKYCRTLEYHNLLENITEDRKNGLKNIYDYASEVHILNEYLNLINFDGDHKLKIADMAGEISRTLSYHRTLFSPQPVKEHKRKLMLELQKKGFIPHDANINQETFNTFIIPRYDWFVAEGHLPDL